MRVGLIDYGMGNLLSVRNALCSLGAQVSLIEHDAPDHLQDAIVLPGVGAFAAGMAQLRARGLDALLNRSRARGTPVLGICLGMQLLMDRGDEGGNTPGLGWVSGSCSRMSVEAPLRVPHIGWNDVEGKGPLFLDLKQASSFYFVHSYLVSPVNEGVVVGTTEHGARFASAVQDGCVYGVQFHPEKSHKSGLTLLSNFLRIAERPC